MTQELPLCNRAVRDQAAAIFLRFRDGEFANDEFEDAYYPLFHQTQDRALRAIVTLVWGTYSGLREHTLPPLEGELRALFHRSILFLQSGLPYQWERDNCLGVAGVSGFLCSVSRIVKRMLGRQRAASGLHPGPESSADWSVWPFAGEGSEQRGRQAGRPA